MLASPKETALSPAPSLLRTIREQTGPLGSLCGGEVRSRSSDFERYAISQRFVDLPQRTTELLRRNASLGSQVRRDGQPALREIGAMNYRTYFLDQDGHISNAIDMECTDDEQAKECAKKFLSDRSAELWKEDRLIAIYAAGKGPLPPPQASRR